MLILILVINNPFSCSKNVQRDNTIYRKNGLLVYNFGASGSGHNVLPFNRMAVNFGGN